MAATLTIYRSSIGKKAIMAISGLVGIGFLAAHMYGNLKIFEGPEYFNHYAAGLRTLGAPVFGPTHLLWVLRIVLIVSVVLHVAMAYQLTRQDWSGRPRAMSYGRKKDIQASYAARTMRWGGVILLLFIVYHLMNLTFGVIGFRPGQFRHPENGEFSTYSNVVNAFSFWPATLIYLVAMIALGFHLYHGFWSMFQTLGLNNYRTNTALRALAAAVTFVLTIGFISVPLAVMFGIVQ